MPDREFDNAASNPHQALDELLAYAVRSGLIDRSDLCWARNRLLDVLDLPGDGQLAGPPKGARAAAAEGAAGAPGGPGVDKLLAPLLTDAAERGLIADTAGQRDLLDAAIMGAITARPSEVIDEFRRNYRTSPIVATDAFYQLCIANNYIHKERTDRNPRWSHPSRYGDLEITVNLAKPEKDPRDIAAARNLPTIGYPGCLLCRENEGYRGRLDYPGRSNLRLVPLTLAEEAWYLQYSPYLYYPEHCIVLSETHVPMKLTSQTFARLLAFATDFPHYFLGSNADLPIVGGSILGHDHFQGGRHRFPMDSAATLARWSLADGTVADVLDWPLATLRLTHSDPEILGRHGYALLTAWRGHDEPETDVQHATGGVAHNTVTPVVRRSGQDYQLDIVLRNNRTTARHPDGIFHPHAEIHPVKRENIGLIEVMGLAVLPGRLATELAILAQALAEDGPTPPEVAHHDRMLTACRGRPGEPWDVLRSAVGNYFATGLEHCGVFGIGAAALPRWRRLLTPLGWAQQ